MALTRHISEDFCKKREANSTNCHFTSHSLQDKIYIFTGLALLHKNTRIWLYGL